MWSNPNYDLIIAHSLISFDMPTSAFKGRLLSPLVAKWSLFDKELVGDVTSYQIGIYGNLILRLF